MCSEKLILERGRGMNSVVVLKDGFMVLDSMIWNREKLMQGDH